MNLTGAFNVLRAAAPHMADGGSIVIISSIDSELPVSGLAHYCASKAGVEALVALGRARARPARHPLQRRRARASCGRR